MGLLDDAIREHLELKRRRGADPGEVAREEADALGPVRREEAAAAAPAAAPAPLHETEPDLEPAGLEEPGAAYAEETPRHREPAAPRDHDRDEHARDHEPEAEPAPDPVVHPGDDPVADPHDITPPHGDPLAHQPTREFSAGELEEALGQGRPPRASDPEVAPGEEDVLEETPEFLQETPEHDRLWFEQKPPKDFDF